jgi:hypothetical protein
MMRFLGLLLLLCANTALAGECRESSPPYGCGWVRGWVQMTASSGVMFFPEKHAEGYTVDFIPDSVGDHIIIKGSGLSGVIVGEFAFCPYAPELNQNVGLHNLTWRYLGCIDDARDLTYLNKLDDSYEKKLCSLIDCRGQRWFKDHVAK